MCWVSVRETHADTKDTKEVNSVFLYNRIFHVGSCQKTGGSREGWGGVEGGGHDKWTMILMQNMRYNLHNLTEQTCKWCDSESSDPPVGRLLKLTRYRSDGVWGWHGTDVFTRPNWTDRDQRRDLHVSRTHQWCIFKWCTHLLIRFWGSMLSFRRWMIAHTWTDFNTQQLIDSEYYKWKQWIESALFRWRDAT